MSKEREILPAGEFSLGGTAGEDRIDYQRNATRLREIVTPRNASGCVK